MDKLSLLPGVFSYLIRESWFFLWSRLCAHMSGLQSWQELCYFSVLHSSVSLAKIHQQLTMQSGRNGTGKRQTGRQADKKHELIIRISFREAAKIVWMISLTFEILQMKN